MQLVEQHVISKTDPRYAAIEKAAFASKNLYSVEINTKGPTLNYIFSEGRQETWSALIAEQ